ncbi:hypothetical protein [Candidatus Amarobacter glycogenicus]|uniref:hypothetical protein n=1 Tax=Candidatus Amarobacter glycogenicus TaxID=3140699 RepID=UPI003134E56D|nr:hypothetical protein [Dehalococcoidia bacterium]
MSRLTPADEYFYHQIPEPLPAVLAPSEHWRESLFFVLHPRAGDGDALVLTLAHYPVRQEMESLQFGRIAGQTVFARHTRPYAGDPHTMAVGPMRVEILEPYRRVRLFVDPAASPIGMDITFTARTQECVLRRGTLKAGAETFWDQSHMLQSGWYNGTYTHEGKTFEVRDWWGQRDHSWGVRDHHRCPMWMWLAIQLPDGMLGVWHWEYADGRHIYTDGYWAPADMSDPVQVLNFEHDLYWIDGGGRRVDYGKDGEDVAGLEGVVSASLADGRVLRVEGTGRWHARYGQLGGGQVNMRVRTGDGREGAAAYEVTGAHHHTFFPVPRAEGLPLAPLARPE